MVQHQQITLDTSLKIRDARFHSASRHELIVSALQHAVGTANIDFNTPAKPMWTSVLTLKLRGFFIALAQGSGHLAPEAAP